jgi:hypothetical protein
VIMAGFSWSGSAGPPALCQAPFPPQSQVVLLLTLARDGKRQGRKPRHCTVGTDGAGLASGCWRDGKVGKTGTLPSGAKGTAQ